MKFSQTKITIEHYRESVVRFDQSCCPNCGFTDERRFENDNFRDKAPVREDRSEHTTSNFAEAHGVKEGI